MGCSADGTADGSDSAAMRFPYNTDYGEELKLLRYPSDKLVYGALLAGVIAAPFVVPRFWTGELAYIFIVAIASISLMVLVGYTGQVSLGHAAFMAIGGYGHAILLDAGAPFALALPAAIAIAGLAGALVGLPALRLSGIYLAVATLAFAAIVEHIVGHWKSLTAGYSGLAVGDPTVLGVSLGGLEPFYFLCLAALVLVIFAVRNLARSRTGRAWKALRDSEAAAYAMGVDVGGFKILAFAVSAAIAGLAGALLAHHLRYLTPEAYNLMLSLQLLLMVVIGGVGTLRGAVLGAVLIGLLPQAIAFLKPLLPQSVAQQSGAEIFLFGAVLVAFVLYEPTGLVGRWLKVKSFFETFPLYRRATYRRTKSYMRSERAR
jgi:branched-chain amino acid transport system permease protein